MLTPEERILTHVNIDSKTGCWNWTGSFKGKDKLKQYGHLTVGSRKDGTRKTISAHRYSFMIFKHRNPEKLFVCHSCDNPKCVNPDHLFLGTQQDNTDDREQKHRNKIPRLTGIYHPHRKINYEIATEIRNDEGSSIKLSQKYGLSSGQIRAIRRGEYWKSPEPPEGVQG